MDLNLEESLGRVFRDKLRLPTVLAGDSATLLPSTRVLLKRREAAEVERELQRQRGEFGQRMELLGQRRQQLCQRKDQLQDVILKFNAFLQASAVRRERVLQRARAAGRENDAARLLQELEGLQQHRERLVQQTESLRHFSDYLQDVVARTGQFQDVPAMLAHFAVLARARATLAQEAAAGQERLAQGRAQLQRYQEETDSELLRTRDELARLRARLEAARIEVLQEVRRDTGCPGTPSRQRGSSLQHTGSRDAQCDDGKVGGTSWAELGVPRWPRKCQQQLRMVWDTQSGPPVPALGCRGHVAVAGGWPRAVTLSPGVPLGADPERGHPEDAAAGADQAGRAEPLPARHRTVQGPHGRGSGEH
ncbi:cilia- and flagella-associated protein 73 [Patagioenas fasciata]|uniref:cilia- and flagella-associated protein 73 n=1 Tax=Patagioenas fasciata TaxID=372321 RepID=UPI003A99A9EE